MCAQVFLSSGCGSELTVVAVVTIAVVVVVAVVVQQRWTGITLCRSALVAGVGWRWRAGDGQQGER